MQRSALVALLASLISVGCASSPWESRSPALDRIQASGQLRVGMAGGYPPLNELDRSGENFGMEPDLARFLARGMGVELVVVNRPFKELLAALEAGELDAVLSGVTMTPERNKRVAFAGPYFISGKAVLTRVESLSRTQTAEDLDRPDITLAALEGTTSETLIRNAMPRATLKPAQSYDEAVQMVIDGRADAMVADYPVCVVQRARHREKDLHARVEPFTFEPIGIALPPNDPLLVNLVDNYLKSLEGTGLLKKLKAKWFEDASWVRRLP